MKSHVTIVALVLLVGGCAEDGGTPALPAPAPTPTPSPAPSPTPSPTPTPTPTPTSASYLTFTEILTYRLGAGVTLPSACSGFASGSQPPAVLPATPYGQGLTFRYVLTSQVWAIGGEVAIGFDGRDGDPSVADAEVARFKTLGADTVRFAVLRPTVGGTGLDYVRLASVAAPVQGANRQYSCVIGSPTIAAEVAASPSGEFRRNVLMATAYVRDGSTSRAYSLGHSVVAIAADMPARRATITLRLIGTPLDPSGPDVDLGTFAAAAPIDPVTGNIVANFTSSDRTVTGAISGRFFGPQAVEVGGALGASVVATATQPAFSFAGAVYGAR